MTRSYLVPARKVAALAVAALAVGFLGACAEGTYQAPESNTPCTGGVHTSSSCAGNENLSRMPMQTETTSASLRRHVESKPAEVRVTRVVAVTPPPRVEAPRPAPRTPRTPR
jgi:hypothetical protein